MSDPFEHAIQAGLSVLEKNGIAVTPETMALVKEAAQAFIDLLDGNAKKHAAAAGDAAAAAIKTEDQAEAAQRKP